MILKQPLNPNDPGNLTTETSVTLFFFEKKIKKEKLDLQNVTAIHSLKFSRVKVVVRLTFEDEGFVGNVPPNRAITKNNAKNEDFKNEN